MRRSLIFALAVTFVLAATVAVASAPPEGESCPQVALSDPLADSNSVFQVVSRTLVRFEPEAEVRVFNDADEPRIEFKLDRDGIIIGEKAYCRCRNPSTCPDNSCEWSVSSGSQEAECSGGCYQSDGDACRSCEVFSTAGTAGSF